MKKYEATLPYAPRLEGPTLPEVANMLEEAGTHLQRWLTSYNIYIRTITIDIFLCKENQRLIQMFLHIQSLEIRSIKN